MRRAIYVDLSYARNKGLSFDENSSIFERILYFCVSNDLIWVHIFPWDRIVIRYTKCEQTEKIVIFDIIFKTCFLISKLLGRDHLITSRYSHQISYLRRERVFNISRETESEALYVYMIFVHVQWRKNFWNLKKHKK